MSATHDNSVLFSLNQLMALHETRVQEEEAEAQRKVEAEKKAQQEAMRKAQELAAQRALEEAERRMWEEMAAREEQARLEAMQQAAVERARIEAQTKARLEMQLAADEHERALEKMREDAKKKKLSRSIWLGAIGGAAMLLGSIGLYYGKVKPAQDALLVQQAANIQAQQDEARRLAAEAEANRKRIARAESLLEEAKRLALEQQTAASKPVTPKTSGNVNKTQAKNQAKSSACLPGEPGCDFNGNRIF